MITLQTFLNGELSVKELKVLFNKADWKEIGEFLTECDKLGVESFKAGNVEQGRLIIEIRNIADKIGQKKFLAIMKANGDRK